MKLRLAQFGKLPLQECLFQTDLLNSDTSILDSKTYK